MESPQNAKDNRCSKKGGKEHTNPTNKKNLQDVIFENLNFSQGSANKNKT
jgi:hypothetical protein